MNSEKMRNIMKEYQDKRDLHAAQLEDRLERIYSKYPQLAQLNRQIQALGIDDQVYTDRPKWTDYKRP